jgi:stress-induced-phosphoprotein 1
MLLSILVFAYIPNPSYIVANPMGAFGQIFSGDVLARIAGNPQISKYLAEPDYVQKIKSLQTNPQLIGQYLQDQRIMQTMGALMGINITSASGPPPSDESVPMETEAEPKPTPAPAPKEPEPESEPEPELSSEEIEAKKLKDASKAEKEKGNQFYKKRQFDEALVCYDAAWESNKDDITILTNKAGRSFLSFLIN